MQSQALSEFEDEKQEFTLKAQVLVVSDYIQQSRKNGSSDQIETSMVLFKVETSTEKFRFFSKYFPNLRNKFDEDEEYVHNPDEVMEVVAVFPHPVNKPLRLSIIAESKHIQEPHFMLASLGETGEVEDQFKAMKNKKITFTTVPPQLEDEFGTI